MIHKFKVRPIVMGGICLGFPVDMLRRDCCWPADDHAVYIISASQCREIQDLFKDEGVEGMEVELRAEDKKNWMPNKLRWASFSWEVIEYNGVRLENGR